MARAILSHRYDSFTEWMSHFVRLPLILFFLFFFLFFFEDAPFFHFHGCKDVWIRQNDDFGGGPKGPQARI